MLCNTVAHPGFPRGGRQPQWGYLALLFGIIFAENCMKIDKKQECIPVGCVPPAEMAVSGGGGCLPKGGYLPSESGVCPEGGVVCLGGCVCLGVSPQIKSFCK